ncbi:putative membrane protein, partial [Acinetobacter baumannii 6112]
MPIWFLSFFIITLFILAILFPKDWTNAQFFTKDGPNHLALFSLLISSSLSSLVTFILILVVWAIR